MKKLFCSVLLLFALLMLASCGHEHRFGEWEAVSVATCEEDGVSERVCADCGETERDEISKLGHNFGEWETVSEATCEADGVKERVCSVCGDAKVESIPKAVHSFGEWENVSEATCEADGVKECVCSVCGDAKVESIPKAEHSFGEWETVSEATCEADGVKERVCSVCGEAKVESIPKAEHSFGEWETVSEATCADEGVKERACSVCSEVETDSIELSNVHNYGEWVVVKVPTVSAEGLKEKVCDTCGNKKSETVDKISPPAGVNTNSDTLSTYSGIKMTRLGYYSNGITITSVNAVTSYSIELVARNDTGMPISGSTKIYYKIYSSAGIVQSSGNAYLDDLDPGESCYVAISINSSTGTIKLGEVSVVSGEAFEERELSEYPGMEINTLPYESNGITITEINAITSYAIELVARNDTGASISGSTKIYYKTYSDAGIVQSSGNAYLDDLEPGGSCYVTISINSSTKTVKLGNITVKEGEDFYTGELTEYSGIAVNTLPYASNGITITKINAITSYAIEFVARNDTGASISGSTKIYYRTYSGDGIAQSSGNAYLDDLDPGESCYVTISINSSTKTVKLGNITVKEGEDFYTGELTEYSGIKVNTLPYASNGITITKINAITSYAIEFVARNDTGASISGSTKIYYRTYSGDGIVQSSGNTYLDDLDPGESCYVTISINSSTSMIKLGSAEVKAGEPFYTGALSEYYGIEVNTLPYESNGITITKINAKNGYAIEFIARNDTGAKINGSTKIYYKLLSSDGIVQSTGYAYFEDLDPGESCYVLISINEFSSIIKFGEIVVSD